MYSSIFKTQTVYRPRLLSSDSIKKCDSKIAFDNLTSIRVLIEFEKTRFKAHTKIFTPILSENDNREKF